MMINTLDLQSTELVYVAEGNANIVLKLTKLKQVLRLPKLEKSKGGGDHELFCYLHRSVKYISILADMCGHEFIFLPRIVKIPEDEAKRINEFITNFRPVNRLGKEFNGKYAMLMQDATAGSTSEPIYSVEIKPKQGWIFDNTIDHIFRLQGMKRCRYCCMQYLKMKMEKISSRSKYCPMDLFSGNVNRMRKAIEAILYEPQNNLRIFKNGNLVYEHRAQDQDALESIFGDIGKEEFFYFLVASLLGYDTIQDDKITKNIDTSSECDPQSNLPLKSILKKVLDLQTFAKLNLPYMSQIELSDAKSYNSLEKLVSKKLPILLEDLSQEELYMIGATLMDASIMITFHRLAESQDLTEGSVKLIKGERYFTRITLLDLDPKPDNHFKKFLRQTNDAYAAFRESNS